MEMLSLSKLKTQASVRAADLDKIETRKRNLLVLIVSHLSTFGYTESCEKLQLESGVSLTKVTVADNMDLLGIMQEFESYYQIKFGKMPKFVRKMTGSDGKANKSNKSGGNASQRFDYDEAHQSYSSTALNETLKKCAPSFSKSTSPGARNHASSNAKKPSSESKPLPPISSNIHSSSAPASGSNSTSIQSAPANPSSNQPIIEAVGTKTGHISHTQSSTQQQTAPAAEPSLQLPDTRLLKPIPYFASSELRDLAHLIQRDIFTQNPNVKWSDIAGLETSKRLIKEAIVFPIKFPQLFTGLLKPWKGILLYGPPGTGKTMLAKAVATECNTTFFNISASSVVSKWRGDSEKLIRVLFELARYHAPSTIFLDELESIMSHRGGAGGDGGEHEGSRRMKTELLIQMDGLSKSEDHVFLLAASNLPWDLDLAMLRRLEKRILIDVPDFDARQHLFTKLLTQGNTSESFNDSDIDFSDLAKRTKGYSGSDINLVCREAAMRPLRSLFDKLDRCSNQDELAAETEEGLEVWEKVLAVSQDDVLEAIKTTKSSSDESIRKKYDDWQKSFGSV